MNVKTEYLVAFSFLAHISNSNVLNEIKVECYGSDTLFNFGIYKCTEK